MPSYHLLKMEMYVKGQQINLRCTLQGCQPFKKINKKMNKIKIYLKVWLKMCLYVLYKTCAGVNIDPMGQTLKKKKKKACQRVMKSS